MSDQTLAQMEAAKAELERRQGGKLTDEQARILAKARQRMAAQAELDRRTSLRRQQLIARQDAARAGQPLTDQQREIIANAQARQKATQTNLTEQGMSGVNETIASVLGAPIDFANWAGDLPAKGINAAFGTNLKTSADLPTGMGTAESYRQGMTDLGMISETQPQTTGQRYARRIGQEVGASVIPGGAMLRTAQAPLRVAAGIGASAVGAGAAGQTSREVAPNSDTADMIASMVGGGIAPMAGHMMTPKPRAPSLPELGASRDAGYDAVRRSNAALTPQAADDLATRLEGTLGSRKATRRMSPKAAAAVDELAPEFRSTPPTISDVDDARSWIGTNVAGARDPSEARLGVQMKSRIDDYLDNLQPTDVTGTNRASEVIDTLTDARDKAHRIHKSQIFEAEDTGAIAKGIRRAATTGTGGNEVNAIRQNVRRVLENPKLRKGFNEAELQAMREIADGTPTQNALRLFGRLAPNAGALQLGGFTGAAGLAGASGNPLLMAPSAIGAGAKMLAERSTRKQVAALGDTIRNGSPLPKKQMSDSTQRIVQALMASQLAQPAQTDTRSEIARMLMAQ